MTRPSVITLDGPAAAGKTSIAHQLANVLGYVYFDTGLMYRAVTLAALDRRLDIGDEDVISRLAESVVIDIRPSAADPDAMALEVDGEDVEDRLHSGQVDRNVSAVSAYRRVREALTRQQRRIAARGQIVVVGRDIGTVVLPDADLKVYLDASVEARARRRWQEATRKGRAENYDEILAAMRRRDSIDSGRDVAPLRPAEDAVIIDTTEMTMDDVLNTVLRLVEGTQVS
ncbi:MAG: (d)CMP kinase [Anaerolineae bacterium]|nr:(d)CMP kinase [Anaerolineae bacterium]